MTFHGLVDDRLTGSVLGEVVEMYVSRAEAEQALAEVRRDEPELADCFRVEPIELGGS